MYKVGQFYKLLSFYMVISIKLTKLVVDQYRYHSDQFLVPVPSVPVSSFDTGTMNVVPVWTLGLSTTLGLGTDIWYRYQASIKLQGKLA